jgi:uncharacterized protein YicC (UPF0701 family)
VARASEGAALHDVIDGQLDAIVQLVDAAEDCPARRPEAIRARLAEQVAALLDAAGGLDPSACTRRPRSLRLAPIFAKRSTGFAPTSLPHGNSRGGGSGRAPLDFLAQEFGREANTLCSKANDASLSRIGLELKAVVDQFREQVQNVE